MEICTSGGKTENLWGGTCANTEASFYKDYKIHILTENLTISMIPDVFVNEREFTRETVTYYKQCINTNLGLESLLLWNINQHLTNQSHEPTALRYNQGADAFVLWLYINVFAVLYLEVETSFL